MGRYAWRAFFTSTGRSAGTPPAAVVFSDGGQVKGNVIGGGIEGRSINFQIKWNDKPDNVWRFWGSIDDDGVARGAEDGPGSGAPWEASTPLSCATPAPASAQQPAPAQKTAATATSDVDIYNIAHDDVDTGDGVVGTKIGMLRAGQQVELAGSCQPNAWCKVVLPDQAGGFGFVLGHLQF